VLFSGQEYLRFGFHRRYDVTPDGQRYLLIRLLGTGRERR
jgi:hypothetical protein